MPKKESVHFENDRGVVSWSGIPVKYQEPLSSFGAWWRSSADFLPGRWQVWEGTAEFSNGRMYI